jgi:hypothetical protein
MIDWYGQERTKMQKESTELFEKLIHSYESYFDITKDSVYEGLPVAAEAAFHSRSEKYVLLKKAQLWAAEAHEYVFIVMVPYLDTETLEAYRRVVLKEGLSRVKPKKDHMYTYVTLLIIADEVEEEVRRAVRKIRYHKDYRFSFYGWSDYRAAVYETGKKRMMTNRAGSDLAKLFESVTDYKRRAKR